MNSITQRIFEFSGITNSIYIRSGLWCFIYDNLTEGEKEARAKKNI